jgi:drug/metabolite transporter (DMT)-like permease
MTVCLWALNFSAAKYVLSHGIAPLAYALPRYAIASVIFAAFTLVLERSLRVQRRDLGVLFVGAFVLFLNQLGYTYAIHFSSATSTALVFGTVPIFAGLIAAATGVQRLTPRFLSGAALSFSGVLLIGVGSAGALSASIGSNALALLGASTWAAYSVAAAPLMTRYSPWLISVYGIGGGTLLLIPFAAVPTAHQNYPESSYVWAVFAFTILGPLVLTNILWFTAIDRLGISRASLFYNLQFFLAAAFGVLLLSEGISLIQVIGGAAIAAAIVVGRLRRAPPPQAVEGRHDLATKG